MAEIWESLIALNSDKEPSFEVLGPAKSYYENDERKGEWTALDFAAALEADTAPLPATANREGYYGPHHFSYWASGLEDARNVLDAADKYGVNVKSFFDLGCASGRVIRHIPHIRPGAKAIGCDINRLHVEWCNTYLPETVSVFQNHSIPSLPLETASVDVASAFSVFTHIEAFETTWLMELKRILRPGGIAWITVHTEHTLADMNPNWPLWKPVMNHPSMKGRAEDDRDFPGGRLTVRWNTDRSYSSNVFYKEAYLRSHWSRIFEVLELRRRFPRFQDVLILRKRPDEA
jgi:SAM-dependent methyltransferase